MNHAWRAVGRGRNCLVLTRQTPHVEAVAGRLRDLGHEPHLLYATRKTKDLKRVLALLANPPADGPPLLVVATNKYVGEGYDCPKRDTLSFCGVFGALVERAEAARVSYPHPILITEG